MKSSVMYEGLMELGYGIIGLGYVTMKIKVSVKGHPTILCMIMRGRVNRITKDLNRVTLNIIFPHDTYSQLTQILFCLDLFLTSL